MTSWKALAFWPRVVAQSSIATILAKRLGNHANTSYVRRNYLIPKRKSMHPISLHCIAFWVNKNVQLYNNNGWHRYKDCHRRPKNLGSFFHWSKCMLASISSGMREMKPRNTIYKLTTLLQRKDYERLLNRDQWREHTRAIAWLTASTGIPRHRNF